MLGLPTPHPLLQVCVVVPARNEEVELPKLLQALAAQRTLTGEPLAPEGLEVILLLNNCTDGSAAAVARWRQAQPELRVHVAEVTLPPEVAHVGRARQMLFEAAHARFLQLARPAGLILTTDADTEPAPDWVAQTQHVVATSGVDGVGGRILLKPAEYARLAPEVRRLYLLDIGYRRALEEMRHHYAPEPHDPFPRHHQHFGGSLAITAGAYGRAGGMPLVRTSEDVALYGALLQAGGRFRHSYRVRAYTSARIAGRAFGGLADAFSWWLEQASTQARITVESAAHAQGRLQELGRWRLQNPGAPLPPELLRTPEPAPAGHAAELHTTLWELRRRNAELAQQPLTQRLACVPQP